MSDVLSQAINIDPPRNHSGLVSGTTTILILIFLIIPIFPSIKRSTILWTLNEMDIGHWNISVRIFLRFGVRLYRLLPWLQISRLFGQLAGVIIKTTTYPPIKGGGETFFLLSPFGTKKT